MRISITLFFVLLVAISLCLHGCTQATDSSSSDLTVQSVDLENEEAAILETINAETRAAFNRDYESWENNWVQEPYVTKTYIDFADFPTNSRHRRAAIRRRCMG